MTYFTTMATKANEMRPTEIARQAMNRVEDVRKAVSSARNTWPDLCKIPGINERWLRAFAGGQISAPPAHRFLAIEYQLAACGALL